MPQDLFISPNNYSLPYTVMAPYNRMSFCIVGGGGGGCSGVNGQVNGISQQIGGSGGGGGFEGELVTQRDITISPGNVINVTQLGTGGSTDASGRVTVLTYGGQTYIATGGNAGSLLGNSNGKNGGDGGNGSDANTIPSDLLGNEINDQYGEGGGGGAGGGAPYDDANNEPAGMNGSPGQPGAGSGAALAGESGSVPIAGIGGRGGGGYYAIKISYVPIT
jgi:hypothetical protein